MDRRNVILTFLVIMCCTSMVWAANDAAYYITMGRLAMFKGGGSLSGLRLAYQTFDNGINDLECPDCSTDRELKFLHAVTGTAMLFIDNTDILVQDSFLELAQQFGVNVTGDSFNQSDVNPLDINVTLDDANDYIVPPGAPQPEEVPGLINAVIPQIEDIIAELESISDTPTFTVIFTPSETGMQNDLEVDYGEVLILKGLLMAVKAQMQAKLAYDVYIDVDEGLLNQLLYVDGINTDTFDENTFSALFGIDDVNDIHINNDLLNPYPELLEVLPTANDPNDGAAILAKARQDMIDGIEYYSDTIDYLRNEPDDQEDDFLYIDQDSEAGFQLVGDRLTTLRNSLVGNTAGTYLWETTKTYNIFDSGSNLIGELVLVYDLTGFDGHDGSLTFTGPGIPTPWEIREFWKEDTGQTITIEVDVEYYSTGDWRQGFFKGTLVNNEDMIGGATFDYWGAVSGNLTGLWGTRTSTEVTDRDVNLNPIFVSPGPVSPRDMLPEFNDFNEPVYGTFGHGLGDDPTLKGILPGMTQHDWALLFDLIPTGDFCGPPGSDQPDGYVDYWDLLYFAQRWHSSPSDTNWDPRCDLDKEDNYVDYWDLLVFAQNWHIGEPP